jgi:Ca2+-binding RTX toxin-like protein
VRRLLSVSVANHVLLIDGTARADTIMLTRGKRAVSVSVNGQSSEFSLRSFSTIRIRAGKGDDLVTIGNNDAVIMAAASVSAGAGDDTVVTGDGNDTITGGDGNDEISTHAGDDDVSGGAGHDLIFGGDGNDRLTGDGNADTILGGYGDDLVLGGTGDDDMRDGFGADSLYGGAGRDAFGFTDSKHILDAARREYQEEDEANYELAVMTAGVLEITNVIRPTVSTDPFAGCGCTGTFEADLAKAYKSVSLLWYPR